MGRMAKASMIKGNERRVVMLKGDRNASFEMAVLFLKEEAGRESLCNNIVKEAEEIIRNATLSSSRAVSAKRRKERNFSFLSFVLGAVGGIAVTFLGYFIAFLIRGGA